MQVTLPLAVPGLIVGAVLVFTGSFTSYATPQLLGGEQPDDDGHADVPAAMVTFDWVGASTIAADHGGHHHRHRAADDPRRPPPQPDGRRDDPQHPSPAHRRHRRWSSCSWSGR